MTEAADRVQPEPAESFAPVQVESVNQREHSRARRSQALVDDLRAVLPPWIAARVLVGLSYLLASSVVNHWVPGARVASGLTAWDGAFYHDIARFGYAALPVDALRFFPLYPLAGRYLAFLVGGNVTVALVVVANASALVAAVLVRRLVLFERADPALADRAVWVTCLFPGSFVLVWAYAEALFLVFALATFMAARRRHFALAAAFGCAAALTRPVGILLAIPIAIEAWIAWRGRPDRSPRRALVPLVAVVAPLAGACAYIAWVGHTFGDPWLPITEQGKLRGSSDPISRLVGAVVDMFGSQRFSDGLHTPFVLLAVVLLVVVIRRWPVSYAVFAGLSLLAALSAENLNSIERYAVGAFPLLFALADITASVWRERVALALCGCGLMTLSALAWVQVYVP